MTDKYDSKRYKEAYEYFYGTVWPVLDRFQDMLQGASLQVEDSDIETAIELTKQAKSELQNALPVILED